MVRWRSESDVPQLLPWPDRLGWGAEPSARSSAAAHTPRWRGSSLPSCSCAPAARRHPRGCRTGFGVGSWLLHRNGWWWSRRRSLLEGSLGPCGLVGSGVFPGCRRFRIRLGRLGMESLFLGTALETQQGCPLPEGVQQMADPAERQTGPMPGTQAGKAGCTAVTLMIGLLEVGDVESAPFEGCSLGFAHYLHGYIEHDRDQFSLVRLEDRDPSTLQVPFKPPQLSTRGSSSGSR